MAGVVIQGPIYGWKPVDDAYISFRYAANLVQGHGFVFNPGERVEGYTNFLWTFLIALCGRLGFDIVKAGMCLGVIFACTAIPLTWLLSKRVALERGWPLWLTWIPPLLLACYPGWSHWAFSGMESPLLACLVMLFLLFGCESAAGSRNLLPAALFGIAGALTRWEFVILWPVIVTAHLFDGSLRLPRRLMRAGILALILAIGFGAYFGWRISYYGDLMPNTYYAKLGGSFLQRIPRGLVYTGELAICWWLPVGLVLWMINCRKRYSNVLTASIFAYMVYVTWTGGDHFAWLRFYLPVLPIAAIMAAEIVRFIASFHEQSGSPRLFRFAVVVALITVFVGTSMRIDYISAQKHHGWVSWWQEVGQWSKDAFPQSYRFAVIPAGIIPYLSGHPIHDLMGLTDREVAHYGEIDPLEAPGHQKSSTASVLKRKPEVILGEMLPFDHPPTLPEVLLQTHRRTLLKLYQMPGFQELYDYEVVKIGDTYSSYWILKEALSNSR